MKKHIIRAVIEDNPWMEGDDVGRWYSGFIPESYIPRAVKLEAGRLVCLVVGPRQAGKSTLIWRTLAERSGRALFLDCQELAIREWLASPALFLADLRALNAGVDSLLFEEIQHLPEAGLFLKGLVDRRTGMDIYATGSSSFDLEADTRESLAGRAFRHLLLPLSVDELAATISGSGPMKEARLADLVEEMLVYGSFPVVRTSDNAGRELAHLVESFIIRDASDRFRIRHIAAFRKLLELMASQIGNLCNFSEWAAICAISNNTVAEYGRLLEETHTIRLVRPFVGGKRAEITTAPKVYFIDTGVRNLLFGGFAPAETRVERGALLENLVFSELMKHTNPLLDTIRFWRSKSGGEVDFVVEHQGRLLALEVKYGDSRGRLTRAARSFIQAYAPESLVVVNDTSYPNRKTGNSAVSFIRPWEVAAAIRRFLN